VDNKQNFSLWYIVAVIFVMTQLDELARALLQHETVERSALLELLGRSGSALNLAA